jgi:hypothetical protein
MTKKHKNCSYENCKEHNPQPIENFYKRNDTACGLYSRCKSCCKYFDQKRKDKTDVYKRKWSKKNQKAHSKKYYAANKESILKKQKIYNKNNKDKIRNSQLKRNYNITLDIYNEMLTSQNHKCAICKIYTGKNNLCVDHNHDNDQVRGLLCSKCNFLIGLAQENTSVLHEAIRYLEFKNATI